MGGTSTQPGYGGGPGIGGDTVATAGTSPDGRRLALPCTAPLPTGYCLASEQGDYIGGGKSSQVGGQDSVKLSRVSSKDFVELRLQNASNGDDWYADFAAPHAEPLAPGLYDPATRYPFQVESGAGLSLHGNGRGCNELEGKFAVEELKRGPENGLERLSITFEQRCEGGKAALRGVVNFNATGKPDSAPTPDKTIALEGKVFRVVYDPARAVVFGLDASNKRLAKIDLTRNDATYLDVVQVPNDACLDADGQRLFVVNKGSSLITQYDARDLSRVRDIAWTGSDWGANETHFKIYCTPDRLYVVDGAWAPGLFSIDGLDDPAPIVVNHSEEVSGVGGLVSNAEGSALYYWYQYGWSAGVLSTGVHRVSPSDLREVDTTGDVADYSRNPLDAPVLLDEGRGLIFSKNKIFDATNLSKLVYSLPGASSSFDGAAENAYALDATRGRVATKNYVYELAQYHVVAPTVVADADQLFFDVDGGLWFLSTAKGQLTQQVFAP